MSNVVSIRKELDPKKTLSRVLEDETVEGVLIICSHKGDEKSLSYCNLSTHQLSAFSLWLNKYISENLL